MSKLRKLTMWLSLIIALPCVAVVGFSVLSFGRDAGRGACSDSGPEYGHVETNFSVLPFGVQCVYYERERITHRTWRDIGTPYLLVGLVSGLAFLGSIGGAFGRPNHGTIEP